jgi:hypothetical protein
MAGMQYVASKTGILSRCVLALRAAGLVGLTMPVFTLIFLRYVAPRASRRLRAYQATRNDVFVVIFGKSGTNWALQMGIQIAHRGAAEFRHIHDLVAWPDGTLWPMVDLDDPGPQRAAPTGMRVVKTHLAYEDIPWSPEAKYVTFVRDPKDVIVSNYHFTCGVFGVLDRISLDQFANAVIHEDRYVKAWAQHTAGAWARRHEPNVLFRTFAEVKDDHLGTAKALAALMGVELTDDEMAAVIEKSSFSWMKKEDHRFAPPRSPYARPGQTAEMIRSGAVGTAKQELSPEQCARIDAGARAALARLGCDLPYDEMFGGGV